MIAFKVLVFEIAECVTRFGETSPLWQKITSHWKFFDGLFMIWQNAVPALADL